MLEKKNGPNKKNDFENMQKIGQNRKNIEKSQSVGAIPPQCKHTSGAVCSGHRAASQMVQ